MISLICKFSMNMDVIVVTVNSNEWDTKHEIRVLCRDVRYYEMPTWKGKMREDGSSQACRALQGTPTSQHTRHCSVMCSRIFLDTVSMITGSTAK